MASSTVPPATFPVSGHGGVIGRSPGLQTMVRHSTQAPSLPITLMPGLWNMPECECKNQDDGSLALIPRAWFISMLSEIRDI
jgi:hypothetical protein